MTSARTSAAPITFAAVALAVQGLLGFLIGSRFLAQAGRIADPTVSGFAGTFGLLLLVPAIVAVVAAVALWRGRPFGRRAGLVMGVLGVAFGLLLALGGVTAPNPALLILALVIIGVNAASVAVLRHPLP